MDRDSIPHSERRVVLASLLAAITLRGLLFAALLAKGYFFGRPWDTFARTYLSWQWALEPYFAVNDRYWLPLQFYLVGSAYRILSPIVGTSSLIVPVVVNQLLFIGSLLLVYSITRDIGGPRAAFLAPALMAVCVPDAVVYYSALSEPLLILWILASNYLFGKVCTQRTRLDGRIAAQLGVVGFLTGATHYVGWVISGFLSLILIARPIRCVARRCGQRWKQHLPALGAALLAIAFPAIWMFENWRVFADPLHFNAVAAQLQAPYMGARPVAERVLIPPWMAVRTVPVYVAAGLAGLAVVFRRDRRAVLYLVPACLAFLMVWASTISGRSAPDQEPRYLVFLAWALAPYMATIMPAVVERRASIGSMAAALLVGALLVSAWLQLAALSNSFGEDVRAVAERAGTILGRVNWEGRLVVEDGSFAESGVIPVVAGRPDRTRLIDQPALLAHQADPRSLFDADGTFWVAIVRNKGFADRAAEQGLHIERFGPYFLITRSVSSSEH